MRKIIGIIILTLLIISTLNSVGMNNEINKEINLLNNPEPPTPPVITGPKEGKLHIRYTYEIVSEDPQCDNLYYTVRCSDSPGIYKSDFCCSGNVIYYNHSWDDFYQTESPYFIRAKATDCKGYESEWSNIEISIPRNKNVYDFNDVVLRLIQRFPILEFLL